MLLVTLLSLAALALAAGVVAYFVFDPQLFAGLRQTFSDRTPRSIFETRRAGLA